MQRRNPGQIEWRECVMELALAKDSPLSVTGASPMQMAFGRDTEVPGGPAEGQPGRDHQRRDRERPGCSAASSDQGDRPRGGARAAGQTGGEARAGLGPEIRGQAPACWHGGRAAHDGEQRRPKEAGMPQTDQGHAWAKGEATTG